MSNNRRKTLGIMSSPKQPQNVAAQIVITAFTDKPPTLTSNTDLPNTLRLIGVGLNAIAGGIEQQNLLKQTHADQVDKKREYLGPRKD